MIRICFVTGTRAEYGLLRNLIKLFNADKSFEVQTIVTGSHLYKKYGNTQKVIKDDGIKINKKIKILDQDDNSDDPKAIIESTSKALTKISHALDKLKPNLIIILGDRYEILAASISATFLRIPICHFHGGESTEGLIDESIRHSVSKMASLHFTANEFYRKRVIQLGENPKNVFNVGGMGIDIIKGMKFITKKELERKLNIKFKKQIFLITFHPVTLEDDTSEWQFKNILNCLSNYKDTTLIFTYPNADIYGNKIISLIKKYVRLNNNSYMFKSLGQEKYYSLLKIVDVVIGNSSSGIIEVPYFKKPTINIGERQAGRMKSNSILDTQPEIDQIKNAIDLALSKKFLNLCKKNENYYGKGGSSKKSYTIIKKIIKTLSVKKIFFDINYKL
tara:strand:- start:1194 stop:2366 length:1173 start_codon:yes stop_codon:yes gene_type:complete